MERYGHTDIHPFALALTLAMGIATLSVRRDRAVIPMLVVAILVTHAQRVVVGGLDFSMLRIVVLFGWLRVLARGETRDYRYQPIDAAIPVWLFFGILAYSIGPRGSMNFFINRLGGAFDAAGIYFLIRILLRDIRDIRQTVSVFSWLAMIIVGPMLVEKLTSFNMFSALGGVLAHTPIRRGELHAQASFSHPIMTGNFGASTMALLMGLYLAYPQRRVRYGAGLAAATGVMILSASSGPMMAYLAALGAWMLWPVRKRVPLIRAVVVILLIIIHFAREQPVWHLIGRLQSITGGTGYHRVTLINEFFAHFHEWWWMGALSTRHWAGHGSQDITNQYILEGVRGGLFTLLAFIAVLVLAFSNIGRAVQRANANQRQSPQERRRTALLGWGLGTCLFAHSVAFIGVSYFGQQLSILYLHLAMIPSFAVAIARESKSNQRVAPSENPRPAATSPTGGLAKGLRARARARA